MGGVNMDISLSQLGMPSASAMGRADEAERTRRLHNIIDTLKQKPGRVSEENVVALCNRLDIGIHQESEGKEGNTYVLAVGESNLIEVSLQYICEYSSANAKMRRYSSAATKFRRLSCKAASTCTTTALALGRRARRSSPKLSNLSPTRAR